MFVGGWLHVFICVVCDCVVLCVLCVLVCLWLRDIYVYVKSYVYVAVRCCVLLYGLCFVCCLLSLCLFNV